VTDVVETGGAKPATAARIYDYHLGGTHNFPADREAAQAVTRMFPLTPMIARAGRAFLQRTVRYAASVGVRQFLDIGSGIPTQGNVHEVADTVLAGARTAYVDIDPVAVAESMEILEGYDRATAVWGDLRDPQPILDNPQVRALIDFDQPVALLLLAVLHFVPDEQAYDVVDRLVGAMAPGSLLIVSHGTYDDQELPSGTIDTMKDIYRQRTATPLSMRSRAGVARFFEGLDLVEPGVVWLPQWRPEPTDPHDFDAKPNTSGGLVAVGTVR